MRPLAAAFALLIVLAACTAETEGQTSSLPVPTTVTTAEPIRSQPGDFDDFIEQSFSALTQRQPELVTGFGLDNEFGTGADRLDDLSSDYAAETIDLAKSMLAQLRTYDPDQLSPDQQITYAAYEWHLEAQIEAQTFRLHEWPVHFLLNGYNQGVITLFTSIHPLTDRSQVDSYINRLQAVPVQVDQVIAWMQQSQAAGITPPGYAIGITVRQLEGDIAGGDPGRMLIYSSSMARIGNLGLDEATVEAYRDQIRTALENSFIPAWEKLIAHLEAIGHDDDRISLSRLPDGDGYYRHLLRRHTSTELLPEEIHRLGWEEVTRIKTEIADLAIKGGFGELGVAEFRQLAADLGGFVDGSEIVASYESMIIEAVARFGDGFSPFRVLLWRW